MTRATSVFALRRAAGRRRHPAAQPRAEAQRARRRHRARHRALSSARCPDGVGAVLLAAEGDHFSAGLDLSRAEGARRRRKASRIRARGTAPSRRSSSARCRWSRCCTARWSAAGSSSPPRAHVRVAERSAYYALPEGSRGIFVGGGGSVRLPRLIGVARMMDMMLTGRTYSRRGRPGHRAVARIWSSTGKGLAKGLELARAHRQQRAAHQFRGDARAAAHRRERSGERATAMESLMAAIAQAATRPRRG